MQYGPKIATNGLVLALDAADMNSYSPNVHPNPIDIFAWTGTNQINCTLSRDSSITRAYGSIPLKMVVTANDSYTGTYNSSTWNLAPAATGQTWTVSVYVKASVPTTIEGPVVFECNSSGVFLSATSAGSFSIGTSWTRISYTVTFGNASTAFIQIRLDGPQTGAAGQTIWWDGLQVERASSATQFNPYYYGNTVWRDFSRNNNNGTLTNGPTYNVTNGGTIVFDGIDDYVTTSFSTTSGQAVSYCGWLYSTESTATYRNFIDSITARPMIWWNNSGQIEFDASYYTTTTVYRNQWVYVSLSKPSGNSSASYYVNGVLVGTGLAYTTPALTPTLFNRGAGQTWKGYSSTVQIYNRALTATEVLQNYNATKTRFGL